MAGRDTNAHALSCCRYAHIHIHGRNSRNEYRNGDRYNKYNHTWHCYACSRHSYTYGHIYTCHNPHYCSEYLCASGHTCPPVVHGNPLTTRPAGTDDYAEDDRHLWKTDRMDGNCRRPVDTTFKLNRQ